MAGFFGLFDYTKPGPGVPKDAPPKARIMVFFEIFSRKFWNLVKINLMFSIFNIPAIIAILIASMFILQKNIGEDPVQDLLIRFVFGSVILCIPVITVGPAQAGFTYILRNYAREEHAFIWWDFKDHALKNFKEGLIISVIDFIVVITMGISINFYLSFKGSNILMSFATGLLILSFVIYLMMHMYIYPMLVTFKLSIRQVYKNALVFAIIKFLPNLGILILCTLLILVSFYNPIIGMFLFPLITVSTIGLIINFFVYPSLKKYMMDKLEDENPSEEGEKEQQEIEENEDI